MAQITSTQVLLFYPNLIGEKSFLSLLSLLSLNSLNLSSFSTFLGYARIGFMLGSFYFALSNYKLTLLFYLLAFGGDVVDGYVARAFKQS